MYLLLPCGKQFPAFFVAGWNVHVGAGKTDLWEQQQQLLVQGKKSILASLGDLGIIEWPKSGRAWMGAGISFNSLLRIKPSSEQGWALNSGWCWTTQPCLIKGKASTSHSIVGCAVHCLCFTWSESTIPQFVSILCGGVRSRSVHALSGAAFLLSPVLGGTKEKLCFW